MPSNKNSYTILDQLREYVSPEIVQVDIAATIFSFMLCVLMSFLVRGFYISRSYSLTGKMHIGSVIPILSAVVFLVIVVVKSSLALSLGLVGALSIVRFRTPIKEPEELVYLFLAISIGLGYASGQILITTALALLILLIIRIWLSNATISGTNEYNIIIKWQDKKTEFANVENAISELCDHSRLIRIDKTPDDNTAVMLINLKKNISVEQIISMLNNVDDQMHITFFEAKTNW
jgi:hypothetical protein